MLGFVKLLTPHGWKDWHRMSIGSIVCMSRISTTYSAILEFLVVWVVIGLPDRCCSHVVLVGQGQLGDAGLVFFWLKRTSLTRTTVEEWGKIMNVLEEGRSWFHEEIARVFGNAAPKFLAVIGINRDVRVETNRCSPECTRWQSHPTLPRAHNNISSLEDYMSSIESTSCLNK